MNPVSYARMLTTTSASRLSRELKVSKQYISRLEQGLYEKPNPTIMKWASDVLNRNSTETINEATVESLYRNWQWSQRNSAKSNKNLQPIVVTKYDRISHSARLGGNADIVYYHLVFSQWLESYWATPHNFCVDMCLHPSPVADYVEGKTYKMPNKLVEVMNELDLIGEGFKTSER